jgi:hypothetical protein
MGYLAYGVCAFEEESCGWKLERMAHRVGKVNCGGYSARGGGRHGAMRRWMSASLRRMRMFPSGQLLTAAPEGEKTRSQAGEHQEG